MKIWVDADACPKAIKEILYRAANRTQTIIIFVANQLLFLPKSKYLQKKQVDSGFDVADKYIVDNIAAQDLVITADIPLADAVLTKGAHALNPRGTLYTAQNIKLRLATRDISEHLRSTGVNTRGPASLNSRDIQTFANALDQWLAKRQLK